MDAVAGFPDLASFQYPSHPRGRLRLNNRFSADCAQTATRTEGRHEPHRRAVCVDELVAPPLDVGQCVVVNEIEIVTASIGYLVARYVLDPLMNRADDRLHRFLPVLRNRLGERGYQASDRVTVRALEEAALTDDGLSVAYLCGILAGSGPDNDAGAPVIAQIARLSFLQLRLHYIVYRAVWKLELAGDDCFTDLRDPDELRKAHSVFIPTEDVYTALGLVDEPASSEVVTSMLRVLAREDLIAGELLGPNSRVAPGYAFDSAAKLANMFRGRPSIPGPGLVVAPTPAGVELFLWGCGSDDHDPVALRALLSEVVNQIEPPIPACPGTVSLRELDARP